LQFVPDHRYAIHVWKIVPINHAVVICSDIFSHVYGLCRFHMFINGSCWTVWNGFAFFVGVCTQSPLPSSCLECGGLQCSHIFIIRCVFICFHSWFSSFPGAFLFSFFHLFSFIFIFSFLFSFLFIYFHLISFVLIYFHFFSFFFISCFFSLLKKPLPIYTTCMSPQDFVLLTRRASRRARTCFGLCGWWCIDSVWRQVQSTCSVLQGAWF
jgi:hypothetical protein